MGTFADGVVVATAQMLGGIIAAAILDGLTPGPLAVSVALNSGTNRTQGMCSRIVGSLERKCD